MADPYIRQFKTPVNMEVIIKKNDAFRMLQTITRDVISNLEGHIIGVLIDERMMSGDADDCGMTVDEIRKSNGTPIKYLMTRMFGRVVMTDEIPELIKHIEFVMEGSDHPCPKCGCELDQETDAEFGVDYIDSDCSNPNCDFTHTTAPDWDSLTPNQVKQLQS